METKTLKEALDLARPIDIAAASWSARLDGLSKVAAEALGVLRSKLFESEGAMPSDRTPNLNATQDYVTQG